MYVQSGPEKLKVKGTEYRRGKEKQKPNLPKDLATHVQTNGLPWPVWLI
jgi:hypothetical protein